MSTWAAPRDSFLTSLAIPSPSHLRTAHLHLPGQPACTPWLILILALLRHDAFNLLALPYLTRLLLHKLNFIPWNNFFFSLLLHPMSNLIYIPDKWKKNVDDSVSSGSSRQWQSAITTQWVINMTSGSAAAGHRYGWLNTMVATYHSALMALIYTA